MNSQQGPMGVVEALARLTGVLSDGEKRAAFASDPASAMQDAGIPPGVLPEEAMSTLVSLSENELVVVSNVFDDLTNAGLYLQLPSDGGRVGFF